MSDLVPRKKRIWGMGEPLGGIPECDLPELVIHDTDGKVLVVSANHHRDLYYLISYVGGACLAVAGIILIINIFLY